MTLAGERALKINQSPVLNAHLNLRDNTTFFSNNDIFLGSNGLTRLFSNEGSQLVVTDDFFLGSAASGDGRLIVKGAWIAG
jgi:hypothetical protein